MGRGQGWKQNEHRPGDKWEHGVVRNGISSHSRRLSCEPGVDAQSYVLLHGRMDGTIFNLSAHCQGFTHSEQQAFVGSLLTKLKLRGGQLRKGPQPHLLSCPARG